MTAKPLEPLNFKLAQVTPRWVFPQRARRMLVLGLILTIALIVIPTNLTQGAPWSVAIAVLGLVWSITSVVWLIGATRARADSPDAYVDEREIAFRNEVYLNAFRWLGGLIAVLYTVLTFLPDETISARNMFTLLFPIVLFAPTLTIAWMQPDPLEGEEP
jgi:hypothetical protein